MDMNKRVGNGRPGLFLLWKERQTREGVGAQDTESGIRGGRATAGIPTGVGSPPGSQL